MEKTSNFIEALSMMHPVAIICIVAFFAVSYVLVNLPCDADLDDVN